MAKRPLYQVTVAEKAPLSPAMLRLRLRGPDLAQFPTGAEGGYVKFVLPKDEAPMPEDLRELDLAACWKRSFTVRAFDAELKELVLDVVSHADGGPAARWIESAAVGSELVIMGPGPVKLIDPEANWFFLVGDMTALPAISVNMKRLPPDAQGYAVLEVATARDQLDVFPPENLAVHWVLSDASRPVSEAAASQSAESQTALQQTALVNRVRSLPWLEGRGSFWAAGELGSMTQLRNYWVKERGVEKQDLYLSSYWKQGAADEQHKLAKKQALG